MLLKHLNDLICSLCVKVVGYSYEVGTLTLQITKEWKVVSNDYTTIIRQLSLMEIILCQLRTDETNGDVASWARHQGAGSATTDTGAASWSNFPTAPSQTLPSLADASFTTQAQPCLCTCSATSGWPENLNTVLVWRWIFNMALNHLIIVV